MESPGERIHERRRGGRGQAIHTNTALRFQGFASLAAVETASLGGVAGEAVELRRLPLRKSRRGVVRRAEFEVRGERTQIRCGIVIGVIGLPFTGRMRRSGDFDLGAEGDAEWLIKQNI